MCVCVHRMMVLMSTHNVKRGDASVLSMCLEFGESLCLCVVQLVDRCELGLWYICMLVQIFHVFLLLGLFLCL